MVSRKPKIAIIVFCKVHLILLYKGKYQLTLFFIGVD